MRLNRIIFQTRRGDPIVNVLNLTDVAPTRQLSYPERVANVAVAQLADGTLLYAIEGKPIFDGWLIGGYRSDSGSVRLSIYGFNEGGDKLTGYTTREAAEASAVAIAAAEVATAGACPNTQPSESGVEK